MGLEMLLRSKNPSLCESQEMSIFFEVKETIEVIEVTGASEVIEASEVIRVAQQLK